MLTFARWLDSGATSVIKEKQRHQQQEHKIKRTNTRPPKSNLGIKPSSRTLDPADVLFIGEGLAGSLSRSSIASSSSSRASRILSACVDLPRGGVLCRTPGDRRGGVAGGPRGDACVGRLNRWAMAEGLCELGELWCTGDDAWGEK
jgi:hypothetical protein